MIDIDRPADPRVVGTTRFGDARTRDAVIAQ